MTLFISTLFGLEPTEGSTRPTIFRHNNKELYLIVFQDSDLQDTVITLDFESENDAIYRSYGPVVSFESKAGQQVDFTDFSR